MIDQMINTVCEKPVTADRRPSWDPRRTRAARMAPLARARGLRGGHVGSGLGHSPTSLFPPVSRLTGKTRPANASVTAASTTPIAQA